MKAKILTLLSISGFLSIAQVQAHGEHISFDMPRKMDRVHEEINFRLSAPFSNVQLLHLNIFMQGSSESENEYFIEVNKEEKTFSLDVDVTSWPLGEYCADVTPLGAVLVHDDTKVCFHII
ncbi:hypothetical protein RCJ22_24370 [Vibrio sp. FNV 38]|nr:hypothetical protein [Vibrio sp. FNV 38]